MPRLTNEQLTYLERIRGTRWSIQSFAEQKLPLELVTEAIRSLTREQRIEFWYDWRRHARPEQLAPAPYSAVHASRGKYVRAEPIAALYEQGKVHHVGTFARLEDQQTAFVPDIDRPRMGSPDRVDALVWALTELVVERQPYEGLMRYYEQQAVLAAGATPAAAG